MHLSFRRIQFTPDLMPADITGTEIIQEDAAHRPPQARLPARPDLRADHPRRRNQPHAAQDAGRAARGDAGDAASPSARTPTSCRSRSSSSPRRIPIEQEGTYPLPEAQKDRFIFLVKVDYPTPRRRARDRRPHHRQRNRRRDRARAQRRGPPAGPAARPPRAGAGSRHRLRARSRPRHAHRTNPVPADFVKQMIGWGAGPRACQQIVLAGKVRALLRGRTHVTIDDIEALAAPRPAPPHRAHLPRRGRRA